MLESGKMYKHIRGIDAAIYVCFPLGRTFDSVKYQVHWVNVVGKIDRIIVSEEISIRISDHDKWKERKPNFNGQEYT